jgi:hypothetical protein
MGMIESESKRRIAPKKKKIKAAEYKRTRPALFRIISFFFYNQTEALNIVLILLFFSHHD